jgi:ADP-ribose pyrophosphatase YjhB (NUDIX family)
METLLMNISIGMVKSARIARYILLRFVGERTMQGVRVIVQKDSQILLVRHWYAPWLWTLPGGGVEIGEEAPHAAIREVREETGLIIQDPVEMTSHEGPMGSSDITIVFLASVEAGALDTEGNAEIMERKWFDRNALPVNLKPNNRVYIESLAKDSVQRS